MKHITMSFTGHRPDKLGGYGPNPVRNVIFANALEVIKTTLQFDPDAEFISGGAVGFDQIVIQTVLYLGAGARLTIARPFPSQSSRWPKPSRESYEKMISETLAAGGRTIDVHPDPYAPWKMQKRNEWMVNQSNILTACWDGSDGGTANCVHYAETRIPIFYLEPSVLYEPKEKLTWQHLRKSMRS